jgi:hypothetical protein
LAGGAFIAFSASTGGILGKLRHGTQQLRHADEVAGRSRERELSNIVADPATAKAAIVDCVLDFN